ncbi:LacI family DNA-binding transcriptional regulator [bacterium]|nr:LacI family DNA-binding transcriptional regulator [bacterium]
MTTLEDVARLAGVSRNSVSLVVQGKDLKKVSRENRARILEAIEKIGYRPNLFARGLTKGQSHLVALICSTEAEAFMRLHFSQLLEGIESATRQYGYSLVVAVSQKNRQGSLDFTQFDSGFVDGFITAETDIYYRPVGRQTRKGRPIIMVRNLFSEDIDCVGIDNVYWASVATNHMLKLGHRRIGFAAEFNHPEGLQRVEGWRQAMTAAGLPWDPRYVAQARFFSHGECVNAAAKLLDCPRPPTAVVCANDFIASVIIQEALKRGMAVPNDLAVIGFDDDIMAATSNPLLTSVRQPFREMGFQAAKRLIERIENPDLPVAKILIPAELVIRDSCGAKAAPAPRDGKDSPRKASARRRVLEQMRAQRPS